MNKKELLKSVSEFKKLHRANDFDHADVLAVEIVNVMFTKQMYLELVKFANEQLKGIYSCYDSFEIAFSLVKSGDISSAQKVYENLLTDNPNDASVLNNLSNIYFEQGNIEKSFSLISKAYKINPDDDVIKNNYKIKNDSIKEKYEQDKLYKNSTSYLKNETKYALEKLTNFVVSVKKNKLYLENKLPISIKQFGWFMSTNEEKAMLLKQQWLERGYIMDTGNRGEYGVHIYEVNPYIEKYLSEIKSRELPSNWIDNIEKLNDLYLENIRYFEIFDKLKKINKKYRIIIQRDFNELVFNYIFQNEKATVILSGSIVETIFMYYCEKNKLAKIEFLDNGKRKIIKLKNASIDDYLLYFKQTKIQTPIVQAIGEVARIYRNMIHPGNEIEKSKTKISKQKSEICFNSVSEIIFEIL